jgi:hypothetical protein
MNRLWILFGWMLVGCGSTALPEIKILSIRPSQMVACEGATVNLELDAVFPTHLDYQKSGASVDLGLAVRIGSLGLTDAHLVRGSPTVLLSATVPPSLAPGQYDVGIKVNDDRPEQILPNGFTVTPTLYPDSYALNPVHDQAVVVPFVITIRAQGPKAGQFNCTVAISSNHGSISPTVSGSFQHGFRVQQVTISSTHPRMEITVTDDAGHLGSSNAFSVNP